MVSKISRGNGDYIEYKYTSTGIKRQTKRHIGGADNYTLFDGEMIYQYSGTDPSLNNFTIAEIQNEEGRFVNNRLEYSYIDHLGNLRLSYRDSLGVAVIVQSGAYDCWGLEIRPLRYLVSGATQDKYTWQGKEDLTDDGLEGWSDFGWRIEDRTIGRWFTPDPADQFESVSTYVYCINNPVSQIDPDGRVVPLVAALIGAGISALTYTASVAMSEGGFNNWNWGSFAKSVGIGALSGAITAGIGSAYGEGVGNFGTELHRAFTHASVQATISHYTGGDVGSSFLSGFLSSGIGSATGNLSNGAQMGISAVSGAGISTAIGGGNFWENLAISGIVVGANHLLHQGDGKPKQPWDLDGDGKLSKLEADKWWSNGKGKPIDIDNSSINWVGLTLSSKVKDGEIFAIGTTEAFKKLSYETAATYGGTSFRRIDRNSIEVIDQLYHYNYRPNNSAENVLRNIATNVGKPIKQGIDYNIHYLNPRIKIKNQ